MSLSEIRRCDHGGTGDDEDTCQQGSATGDGTTSAGGAPANMFPFTLCHALFGHCDLSTPHTRLARNVTALAAGSSGSCRVTGDRERVRP